MKKLIIAILLISTSVAIAVPPVSRVSQTVKRVYTIPDEASAGAVLPILDTTWTDAMDISSFRRGLFTFAYENTKAGGDTTLSKCWVRPVIQTSHDGTNWLTTLTTPVGMDTTQVTSADGDTIKVRLPAQTYIRFDSASATGYAAYPGRWLPYVRVGFIVYDSLQVDHTVLNGKKATNLFTVIIQNQASN